MTILFTEAINSDNENKQKEMSRHLLARGDLGPIFPTHDRRDPPVVVHQISEVFLVKGHGHLHMERKGLTKLPSCVDSANCLDAHSAGGPDRDWYFRAKHFPTLWLS